MRTLNVIDFFCVNNKNTCILLKKINPLHVVLISLGYILNKFAKLSCDMMFNI